MSMTVQSRARKLLGDFGEGLVTYALIRKGYEVAMVDHVGADLIVEKGGLRFAVSVKTRQFKSGSVESRGVVAEELHLKKLDHFSEQFGMVSLFALVVCIADESAIHLMIVRTDDIRNELPRGKHGYAFRFSKSKRQALFEKPFIDYSCWGQESIGEMDFVSSSDDNGFQSVK